MAIRRPRRGVSLGTVFVLSLFIATLFAGAYIFTRISGDMDQISIDPKLLTEPLNVLARTVIDTGPAAATKVSEPSQPPAAIAAASEPTAAPAPTPPPKRTLTLSAVGQITIGKELRDSAADGAGTFAFDSMLAPVSGVLRADLSVATMRTGITDTASEYETYRAPSAILTALRGAGVGVLNFATDRVMDYGSGGVTTTRAALEAKNATFTGIYRTQSERDALTVEDINGIRIGLLAYTETISSTGKKAASAAEINAVTRQYAAEAAAADIRALREKGAEIVVVFAYWGNRADTKASAETRASANALIAAGADIILGANPSSVHEIERRTVSDAYGERETFVAYSLGNFLTDDSRDTLNITGLALRLSLEYDPQARRLSIQDASYMPTWIMRWRDASGVNRYRIIPAGVSTAPSEMTDSIYINMKKAYEATVNKLGTAAAAPKAE